jgi:enamine deaminase RidA (YjgF/YER057c/UK114 family)
LKAAGATWDDVVFRRLYVLDMDAFIKIQTDPAMTFPWHPDRPPPSTLVGVTRLSHPDFLIEIDLFAVTGG